MEERIANLLEEKFQEEEFKDCFLVEIVQAGNKLDVFIDSDSGITFQKCQQVSRYLENEYLDVDKPLGEEYTLNVGSPGVGRPLQSWRQYPRNVGRKLEIKMQDGSDHEGTLVAVEPNQITLEEKVRFKEGKRTKTEVRQTVLNFDDIKKTTVKISFK